MSYVMELLETIATAGRNGDGSYTRPCYSPAYFQAVAIVEREMKKLGMSISHDAAGNVCGHLPGRDLDAKTILMGSHLDTVPQGGLLDGAYGVAGALAVLQNLKVQGIQLRHSVEVYGFNAEESNPMGGSFGSRAIAGQVAENQLGLAQALAPYGRSVADIMACRRDFSNAKAYLELHIEQGGFLEQQNLSIGVVTGISSIIRYRVTAKGESNHGGTTLMHVRKDAMVAMAKLIVAADEACRAIDPVLVLTVGTIDCQPGSANVIANHVECIFEMRHMNPACTDDLIAQIRHIATTIGGVDFEIVQTIDKPSVLCDDHLIDVIDQAAQALHIPHVKMPSGAGHDANPLSHVLPVGMVFVPSHKGLSHCVDEWTDPQHLEQGVAVLGQALLALDKETQGR